jgi:hypothetical protein
MKLRDLLSLAIAAAVGISYSLTATAFWGWYVAHNPILEWLLDVMPPREYPSLHLMAVHSVDLIINVLLATPFAAILLIFVRSRVWLCLLVAVLTALLVNLWGTDLGAFRTLSRHVGFWMGIGYVAASLPIGFLLLRTLRRPATDG